MEKFQYTPLNASKTEIRLIELLPRATKCSSQSELGPRCNLIHVSLDDKPDYAALSYTWGDPRDTQTIMIGSCSVPVTRNLYFALKHLQYKKTARVIWVDALCINQSDNEEKGWQVELMREIYQRATFVSIWLGLADDTSDKVMGYLHSFGTKAMEFGLDGGPDILRNISTQWKKLASQPASFRDRSMQRVTIKSSNGTEKDLHFLMKDLNELYYSISGSHELDRLLPVQGMAKIFTRDWWSRTWVLQEISLAQKANFICGTKQLSRRQCTAALRAFKALWEVLSENFILNGAIPTVYQNSIMMADFDHRSNVILYMWNTVRKSPYPLLALLRSTCLGNFETPFGSRNYHLKATDPRDKIYGLLGLAVDRDSLKEFGIQPDYTQSCRDLYISVAVALLRQGYMCALSLIQFPKAQAGLPSWVPDWSKPLKPPLQDVETDHITQKPEFRTSGILIPTKPVFNLAGEMPSVSLSASICDEVYEVGTTLVEFFPLKDKSFLSPLVPAKRLLTELIRLSFLRGNIYRTIEERIRAAARTVAGEIGYNDNGKWDRIGNQRYRTALSLLAIRINDPDEAKLFDAEFRRLLMSEGLQPEINIRAVGKYIGDIAAKVRGRKLFVTTKGHLGLGPDHLVSEDLVTVLFGCQVPFLLRKSMNGKYEVVGEAYVDGIMDGEAVVGKECVGTIELC
jgi:hypothetical protein